jgi:hypothetical protein
VSELAGIGCLQTLGNCGGFNRFEAINYVDGDVRDDEQHTIIDFAVGREVGFGAWGMKSTVSAGLRHAKFESETRFSGFSIPDWHVPSTNFMTTPGQHHRYEVDISAQREFEGAGPILSWDAAKQLLGSDEAGHLDADLSVEGGVLFGKQKTFGKGAEHEQYFNGYFYYSYAFTHQIGPTVVTPPATPARSKSATVPTFAAALGLSYEVQRVKVSGGYRWERYFDVLDAGWAEHKEVNRTIDGPYFNVSVGFGG